MELSDLEIMGASGMGAAIAVFFTNPLEVAKTRLQMQNELIKDGEKVYRSGWDCLRKTWQHEGWRGVQRGLDLAVLRDGSKCFFRLGLYEPILRRLHSPSDKAKQPPFWLQLSAGGLSGLVASTICNPLDIAKVRIQTSGGFSTSHHDISTLSSRQVFEKIIREEGIAGLWKGTQVNILRGITFTSSLMAINSRVKSALAGVGLKDGLMRDASASFVGSLIGTFCMNPVDVIRTRLYNQPKDRLLYNGIGDAVVKIARSEGLMAFWKGLFSHFCRVGPHTVLSFIFIGEIKRQLLVHKTQRTHKQSPSQGVAP